MKRLLIICLLCIFSTGVFSQSDMRASFLIGNTETMYHKETIYGVSYSINNLYLSGGGTSDTEYDGYYAYFNCGYIFNVSRYFTIGPIIGYAHQKGFKGKHYDLLNYGCTMNAIYPLKGISRNGGILFNFEMTRHHTNYGVGLQVFF